MLNTLLENKLEKVLNGEEMTTEVENVLLRSYQKSKESHQDMIVIDEIIWEKDLDEFYKLLKNYKIENFVIINNPAAMDTIYYLVSKGSTVTGTYKHTDIIGQEHKGLIITL